MINPKFLKDNLYLLVTAAWLITISFIIDNYWSANTSLGTIQHRLQSHIQQQERAFEQLDTDSAFVRKILSNSPEPTEMQDFTTSDPFVFFYKHDDTVGRILYRWNTQTIVPSQEILDDTATRGFALLSNGYYTWIKKYRKGWIDVGLIPVKWNYIITNDYLRNEFTTSGVSAIKYDVGIAQSGTTNILSVTGKKLFSLVARTSAPDNRNNIVSVWLRLVGTILILLFIHLAASYLASTQRFYKAALFLFAIIVGLRFLSYHMPLPLNFRQFELFDPTIYGSNFVLRSLGDLLINAILFLWFITFVRYHLFEKGIRIRLREDYQRWGILGLGSLIIVLATYTGADIVRSMIADSQISFDVINFFSLNIYSVIGFIVLCCVAIGYYFLCQVVLYLVKPLFPKPFIALYLCITIFSLLVLSFNIGKLAGGFELYVLAWMLFFIFLLNYDHLNLLARRVVTSKLVMWLFFFSFSISAVIIMENNRKELMNRQHYAEILATKSDPASETLLNSMLTDFRVDYLADNFYRFTDSISNQYFKDSLVSSNFTGYTDKYDTHILTFNEKEMPLYNMEGTSYNDLNTILNTQARPTGIPYLFYYDESYDRFSYITKRTIVDLNRNLLGYVFILVSPRNFKNENIYPELFGKGHRNSIENSSAYAFAIYSYGKLISSHNDYPFATQLPENYFAGHQFLLINKASYNEMWYNAGGNKYVVIVKENSLSIESITLFSYLFCSFLLLTAIFWLINILVRSRLNWDKLKGYWQLTVRNQIHGTIIFFSIVSFLVIGVATILFFISRYENNNREKLSSTIRIMEKEVKSSFPPNVLLSDTFEMRELGNEKLVEQTINKISGIHGVDVNVYDLDGNLKISSLPLPYIKGIVSTKMEPLAYYHMNKEKEVQYFQKEHIGNLKFLSNYVPVLDESGNEYAYINIPYFTSQNKLQEEIANFLVTIINLNAFIFLIAGIVALFITNRITNSFALISEKMKRINLGTRNEAITWHRRDEIGELVDEYNKMVNKLDESAEALAKTEREGAWKEMARQVAHEIKNPLTPMKLSMQFLQNAIENNAPNVKELSARVANTMVEQIDHLSKIASEFSQFANIDQAKKVNMDLNESFRSLKQLYSSNPDQDFIWDLEPGPVYIFADPTHINRLFTNLIQNAIQAAVDDVRPEVRITEKVEDGMVTIRLSDNGEGIAEAIQSRIFTPNFTTKTSGTGLGLAMCKRMVEQSNGEIWFETSKGSGTTFYVTFPITLR